MRGLRRRVGGRASVALLLPVLVAAIVLLSGGVALADQWSDISDTTWVNTYKVTPAQAAVVSDGFVDGTFRPKQAVTRGQFAKFVVDGFEIAKANPAVGTFKDVAKSSTFYMWIEGGVDAGVISGFTDGTYKPNSTISRQQSDNILGSYLSKKELSQKGTITGSKGTYSSLSSWYAAEGPAILQAFSDSTSIAAVHAPGTAYLVMRQVLLGSGGKLTPTASLTRAQAVALIVRVDNVTFGSSPTGVAVLQLTPASGPVNGGNFVVIRGANFTSVTAVKFGANNATSFTVNSTSQITAVAPSGTAGLVVDVTVTTSAGTSAVGTASKYTYGATPTVTALNPTGGSTDGGNSVLITGTNFVSGATVKFGATPATAVVVTSGTTITCTAPPHAVGKVDVQVTTTAGSSATEGTADDYYYGIPTVTAVSPNAGPIGGGTLVTITGSNFITGAEVHFGGTSYPATDVVVVNGNSITCRTPAHTTGVVDVIVKTTAGPSATTGTADDYAYGAPTVTSLTPAAGKQAGGDQLQIRGSGFVPGATVYFGGSSYPATNVTVIDSTTLRCTSPAHALGKVDVTVRTPAGESSITGTGDDFYYYPLPTVTGINPNKGPAAGLQSVTITGTNFGLIAANVTVTFGTSAGTVLAVTDTTVTVRTPSSTSTAAVDVIVKTPGGSVTLTGAYRYYAAPTITTVAPNVGKPLGNDVVTITGTNFGTVLADVTVKFGGASALVSTVTNTTITVLTPAHAAGVVPVEVTTPAGTATKASAFTYGLPTITSVTPDVGKTVGPDPVTIIGTNFGTVASSVTVRFGGTAGTISSLTDTTIVVTPPNHAAGTVDVTVTAPGGTATKANGYTYGAPTITTVVPNFGSTAGGQQVTITGTNFGTQIGSITVTFGGTAGTVTAANGTTITVTTPGHAAGTVNVVVTVAGQTTQMTDGYEFGLVAAPSITSISPPSGRALGNETITIEGTNFGTVAANISVTFGGLPGTGVSVVNGGEFTVKTPAHAPGAVTVVVTTPGGSVSALGGFVYEGPVITSVSPNAGPTAGEQTVTINGSGFGTTPGDITVAFGGSPAAVSNVADTAITVKTPPHTAGAVNVVVVRNLYGTATLTGGYTYSTASAPTISTVSPSQGKAAGGDTVIITGTNFGTSIAGVSVSFGPKPAAAITAVTNTQITVTTPSGTGNVDVDVSALGGTVKKSNAFTYLEIPQINGISPNAGKLAGGDTITITGVNFGTDKNAVSVTFGGSPGTVTAATGSTITVTTPSHAAGAVDVIVTAPGGTDSEPNYFTYLALPTFTICSPGSGAKGLNHSVTITGTNFAGPVTVTFGGQAANNVVVVNDTTITCDTPAYGTAEWVTIVITTPGGTVTQPNGFLFTS